MTDLYTREFLVDQMLGKLSKYLRILGLDAVYFTKNDLSALIEKACQEKRIVLSRNAKLKTTKGLSDFVFIKDDQPDKQLYQVIKTLKIAFQPEQLFTRCLACNQKLMHVEHDVVEGKVPHYIFFTHQIFFVCPHCKKFYWKGTHLKKMKEIIRKGFAKDDAGNNFFGL